jgi:hypothetical protein
MVVQTKKSIWCDHEVMEKREGSMAVVAYSMVLERRDPRGGKKK